MNEYTVYMHRTPNNKYYVGITKQSVDGRWKNSLGYAGQKLFWRAIQKYGWENIEHIIVAENLSHDDACKMEIELIAKYQSNNPKYGYNRTSGGDGTCNFSHKNPHDDEWRRKVGDANRGKKRTDEAKQKMREAKLGTHWSKERKQAYSKAQKERGFKPSQQCIEASHKVRVKPILQYDIDDNLIATYESMTDAATKLGVSIAYISLRCNNKQRNQKATFKLNNYIFKRGE